MVGMAYKTPDVAYNQPDPSTDAESDIRSQVFTEDGP
jgi:hypothetical protein